MLRLTAIILLTLLLALIVFMPGCRGPEGPAGPSASESLTDPQIQPKVIYTYPATNSVGPYTDFTGQMTIRFNKIMNKSSVRQALRIEGAHAGVFLDTSAIRTVGGDVFTFTPLDSLAGGGAVTWRVGESFTIRLASGAKDINGNALVSAFSMALEPEPYFRVTVAYPANGSTDVPLGAGIIIRFNSPVGKSILPLITLSPGVPGTWQFPYGVDSTSLSFQQSSLFGYGSTFTLTIDSTAADKFGNPLAHRYIISFRTIGFRVTNTSPASGTTALDLRGYVTMDFSGAIDTGSVRAAFGITPASVGSFSMYRGGSYFDFFPSTDFVPNAHYVVTLSTVMKSLTGIPLAEDYTLSFATDSFRVSSFYPGEGASNVPTYSNLEIDFNALIDLVSIDSGFAISPAVPGTISSFNGWNLTFTHATPFQAQTKYVVTVSAPTRTKEGYPLLRPYKFSFITGD